MQRNNLVNDAIAGAIVGFCAAVAVARSAVDCNVSLANVCKIAAVIEENMGGSIQTMMTIAAVGTGAFYCLARMFPAEDREAVNEEMAAKAAHRMA